jgi:hypothetical protein
MQVTKYHDCCRHYFHSPGMCTEAKVHIWQTIVLPTLLYGLDCVAPVPSSFQELEKCQSTLIKRSMGLGKRSHHSHLLTALRISPVQHAADLRACNLFARMFRVRSPSTLLSSALLSRYMLSDRVPEGTLLHRVLNLGMSPIDAILTKKSACAPHVFINDGFVDSLQFLLFNENFVKPWSVEYILTSLLTSCF